MKEKLELFRDVIENNDELVIVFDGSFKIIYINPAYCSYFNKTLSELSGQSFFPLIHPNDRDKVKNSIKGITIERPNTSHTEQVVINNGIYHLRWNTKGVFDKSQNLKYFIGIGSDVTAEVRYYQELEKTKERYRQAEIIGLTGNWEYVLETEEFWGSEGAKRLYGFDPKKERLSTEEVESRIPERKKIHQKLIDLIEKDSDYDIVFPILPKNQQEPRIISSKAIADKDESGKVLKVIGVIQDVTKRYKAEEELKASEYRFKKLIEIAPEAVYLINESGIITDVNSKACEMLNRTREELIGTIVSEVDPNFPASDFDKFWEKIPIDEPMIFPTTHKHKDGYLIPVEIAGVKFLLDNQIHYYGLARDITERLEMEEKLKTSEERFKLAVEGTKDGLWDWNLLNDEAYHSDRFATMLGYEPSELPYTKDAWEGLIHPEDKEQAWKKVRDYLEGKTTTYVSTFRMKCKDGYYRWITGRGKAIRDEDGKPYRFVGFNTDITKRKNIEHSFIQSEEKFHKLFDTMLEGVIFYNKDGYITEANNAAEEILGVSLSEMRGKRSLENIWRIIKEDGSHLPEHEYPIINTLKFGVTVDNFIMGIYNPVKDRRVWITVTSIPIYEKESDQPVKAYVLFQDVTQRRKYLREIAKMNETMRYTQKMAKIGYWNYDFGNDKVYWSEQLYDIFGRKETSDAPTNKEYEQLIHPDDYNFFMETVDNCIKGKNYNIVIRIIRPDGSIRLLNTQGYPRYDEDNKIIEIFGTAQDVTELKKNEEELKKYQLQLEELVKERTFELEEKNDELMSINKTFVGREFRIKGLRDEVKKLKKEIEELKS